MSRLRGLTLALLLALTTPLLPTTAQRGAEAEETGARGGQDASVGATDSQGARAPTGGSLARYDANNAHLAATRFAGRRCKWLELDGRPVVAFRDLAWYDRICWGAGRPTTRVRVQHTPPVDDATTRIRLVERVRERLDLSLPAPTIDPGVVGLVGLPTNYHLPEALQVRTRTATAGAVSATIEARPRTLIIDPGDGSDPFTCDVAFATGADEGSDDRKGPPRPCRYTYQRPSEANEQFAVQATVIWKLRWTDDEGNVANLAANVAVSPVTPLEVDEVQAIITR